MNHYRGNSRDTAFLLFELFERESVYGTGVFKGVDGQIARSMLGEAARYAEEKLAESFADGPGVSFDPATHAVTLPPAFRAAARDYLRSGWIDVDLDPDGDDERVPPSLAWSLTELMLGANPPIPMGALVVPQVVNLLRSQGTPAQRVWADLILQRHWMVTIALTEADAGSDVGAARTRATPRDDGSWQLEGVKRFITFGDHDLSDNIVHLVLARPVTGGGRAGTKGLSLFLVPKYHVDLGTGLLGDRNGVLATALEHKMGQQLNPTVELTFGATEPAVGWLIGDEHRGIAQMFEIIKHLRMLVGVKAMATLSSGYLHAVDYATQRIQGKGLTADPGEPELAIADHPDVRRSLLTQKAYAEGMRALILYTATLQDEVILAGAGAAAAESRHQLLLPVIKGYCSETAFRVLAQETLQVFGGSGYLRDYPIEQYVRDSKVDTLYEGTTGIQALDLFTRKILRDSGAALDSLLNEIASTVVTAAGLTPERDLLSDALLRFRRLLDLVSDRWHAGTRDLAALDLTSLLLGLGDLVCGWLLLRGALTAEQRLAAAVGSERDFYLGKVSAARWFARQVLPGLSARLISASLTENDILRLPWRAL